MGMDPVTLGLGASAIGSLYGAYSGDQANKRAARASNKRQNYINSMGEGLMGGANSGRFQDMLTELLGGVKGTPTEAPTFDASTIDINSLLPDLNVGNDSLMQLLRANPETQMDPVASAFLRNTVKSGGNTFDTSNLFSALGTVDERNINKQVSDLLASSSGGGLGERFGTATAARGGNLRRQALEDLNARNAGIQMQSFESGQGRAMSAANSLQTGLQQLLGLKLQGADVLNRGLLDRSRLALEGAQGNQNAQNRASEVNASNFLQTAGMNEAQRQALFGERLQAIMQAAGLFQGDRNYRAGIFQTMAGLPGSTATAGASNFPGAFTDIGQLLLLLPYLRGNSGGGGGGKTVNYGGNVG